MDPVERSRMPEPRPGLKLVRQRLPLTGRNTDGYSRGRTISCADKDQARARAYSWVVRGGRSGDVFPDLVLQHVGNDQEYRQEHQHPHAHDAARTANRLADIFQEVDGIAHKRVIVLRRQRPAGHAFEVTEDRLGPRLGSLPVRLFKNGPLVALQLPQHVRHAGAAEVQVIYARWTLTVEIETFQEIKYVVGASRARHQRHIRRRLPEPSRCRIQGHRRLDRLERLFRVEHQVFYDLVLRQSQVLCDAVITHVLRRVTAGAVGHEVARAALQGSDVAYIITRRFHLRTAGGGEDVGAWYEQRKCN